MRRGVIALDRMASLLLGLVLVVGGAAAFAWRRGWIPDASQRLEAPWLPELVDEQWWPWAVAGGGVVLVLLGLAWLARHLPRRTGTRVTMDCSGPEGRLTLDLGAATSAAAQAVVATDGVRSANGRQVLDRGELVAELIVEIEPTADLATVRDAAARASAMLAATVGIDRMRHRTLIRVARSGRPAARVD